MAVDLNEMLKTIPARIRGSTDTITAEVPAGKEIKIETSPDGENIAAGTVPDGKVWFINIVISIKQKDA